MVYQAAAQDQSQKLKLNISYSVFGVIWTLSNINSLVDVGLGVGQASINGSPNYENMFH